VVVNEEIVHAAQCIPGSLFALVAYEPKAPAQPCEPIPHHCGLNQLAKGSKDLLQLRAVHDMWQVAHEELAPGWDEVADTSPEALKKLGAAGLGGAPEPGAGAAPSTAPAATPAAVADVVTGAPLQAAPSAAASASAVPPTELDWMAPLSENRLCPSPASPMAWKYAPSPGWPAPISSRKHLYSAPAWPSPSVSADSVLPPTPCAVRLGAVGRGVAAVAAEETRDACLEGRSALGAVQLDVSGVPTGEAWAWLPEQSR